MKGTKVNLDSPDWKGQWALVTGASSGIGRQFASQLAAKGIHVVLVARRAALLQSLAAELAGRHSIRVLPIAADLADPTTPGRLRGRLEEEGIRIRLLVNNAAFGRWGRFEMQDSATYGDMLQVNITAPVVLCRELLTQLASFPDAAIINVSSPAAYQPVPFMAAYAASKAFLHHFGQALYGEWGQQGILVQTLLPGPTATEFDNVAGSYASAIKERDQPATVVTASLQGLATGRPVVCSARGTLQQRLFALMPATLVIRTVSRMFSPPNP
jgi:short-subunit dehydrogenase